MSPADKAYITVLSLVAFIVAVDGGLLMRAITTIAACHP